MTRQIDKSTAIKRVNSPYLNKILGWQFPVLDKGFIRAVDYMGDESSILQAARVSYGSGTKSTRQDKQLLDYLLRNNHASPFEMPHIRLHVKLPIFVARQWIRHRLVNLNEYSARYSVITDDFYEPEEYRLQDDVNKQGSNGVHPDSKIIAEVIKQKNEEIYKYYLLLLEKGVSREMARTILPTSIYTEWYWQIDLRNLLGFLRLRDDHHAQLEIREYAKIISDIVKMWLPNVYDSYINHIKESVTFSKNELTHLRQLLDETALAKLDDLRCIDAEQNKILKRVNKKIHKVCSAT